MQKQGPSVTFLKVLLTDGPDDFILEGLFFHAADGQTGCRRAIVRSKDSTALIKVQSRYADHIAAIRRHRPIITMGTSISNIPSIVFAAIPCSGIPGCWRTYACTEGHTTIGTIEGINYSSRWKSSLCPDTVTASVGDTPAGRAWVVNCLD